MPAYKNTFTVPARSPLCITPSGPVTAARVQNIGDRALFVQVAASGTVAPDFAGAMEIEVAGGWAADRRLSDLFPADVALGGGTFLWVYGERAGEVSVSHA